MRLLLPSLLLQLLPLLSPAAASRSGREVQVQLSAKNKGDAPNSDARGWWPAPPAIHFTPAGMRRLPPHDIAGVLYDERAGVWWLWVYGCELADGPAGWQLCSSKNLVDWKLHGRPTPVGGTGSVMTDPRTNDTLLITNNVQLWRGVPGAPAGVAWTRGFAKPLQVIILFNL
jgi:hypothetical protein